MAPFTGSKPDISIPAMAKLAGTLSWIIPIIAAVFLYLSDLQIRGHISPSRAVFIVVIIFLMLFFGFALGLFGAIGGRKHMAKATIVSGVIGIVLNGGLFLFLLNAAATEYKQASIHPAKKEVGEGNHYGRTYHNPFFGFTLSFPADWQVQDIKDDKEAMEKTQTPSKSEKAGEKHVRELAKQTAQLFLVFKFPASEPVAFNPGFTCLAENVAHLPEMKNGVSYLINIKNMMVASKQPFEFPNEIATVQVGNVPFDVLTVKKTYQSKTFYQEYYVTVLKGYVLGFILSYSEDADKKALMDSLATLTFPS